MLTDTEYASARAICDKAKAYWDSVCTRTKGGWTSLTAEQAQHPDWQACTNDMRSAVEQYELHRDKPDKFTAYVQEPSREQRDATNVVAARHSDVTTWTGLRLGVVVNRGAWQRNNFGGKWRSIRVSADWSRMYYGREYASRQFVNLRATKR